MLNRIVLQALANIRRNQCEVISHGNYKARPQTLCILGDQKDRQIVGSL